jgi:hypothetical protein
VKVDREELPSVRWEITARSFWARAAYRGSRNGSTSGPKLATRNDVLCLMRPLRYLRATATDMRRTPSFAERSGAS